MRPSLVHDALRASAIALLIACGAPPATSFAATDLSSISAGVDHTCALTPSGAAECWGQNDVGQSKDRPGPYTELTTGGSHTCGLTPAGVADCWGRNNAGLAEDHPGPYVQVSAGDGHNCALRPDGSVDCWGLRDHGQAKDQPGPFTQLSAGDHHNCALRPDGSVDCWGRNDFGQAMDQPGPYVEVSAGSYHTCALTSAGDTDCWGDNRDGQLGRRLTISAPSTEPRGSRARVTGHLRSIDPDCVASQTITVLVLRPAGIPSRTTTTSSDGRYASSVRITRDTVVRVVYAGTCERVVSERRTITGT